MQRTGFKRQVSKKRAVQNSEYLRRRRKFLDENSVCPVTGDRTEEIHHKDGREGELLLDESKWMAVSPEGHRLIHARPNEARKRGWLI